MATLLVPGPGEVLYFVITTEEIHLQQLQHISRLELYCLVSLMPPVTASLLLVNTPVNSEYGLGTNVNVAIWRQHLPHQTGDHSAPEARSCAVRGGGGLGWVMLIIISITSVTAQTIQPGDAM